MARAPRYRIAVVHSVSNVGGQARAGVAHDASLNETTRAYFERPRDHRSPPAEAQQYMTSCTRTRRCRQRADEYFRKYEPDTPR